MQSVIEAICRFLWITDPVAINVASGIVGAAVILLLAGLVIALIKKVASWFVTRWD